MNQAEVLDAVKAAMDRHKQATAKAVAQLASALVDMEERFGALGDGIKELTDQMHKIMDSVPTAVKDVVESNPDAYRGLPGEPGQQGAPGEPGAPGLKGDPGDPGNDAEPVLASEVVAELIKSDALGPVLDLYATEAVAKHLEAHPVRNGEDGAVGPRGEPGADGKSVTLDDVALFLDAAIAKHVLELERRATDTIAKAIDKIPTPRDGRDGVDGLSFDQVSGEYDAERGYVLRIGQKELVLPYFKHSGFWREGMAAKSGELTTHDGALWIAKRDTTAKPCLENADDWTLAARKGRDGKDGRNGIDKTAPVTVNQVFSTPVTASRKAVSDRIDAIKGSRDA